MSAEIRVINVFMECLSEGDVESEARICLLW